MPTHRSIGRRLRLGAIALVVIALARPQAARAELCLPSLAEGGRRLHEMPAPSVFWLELLLRQHEACWTVNEPHDRLRVFLYGNSAVVGHPEPVEDTAAAHLDALWKSSQLPAHVFNFGFVTGHAMKDMLIVHESLRYRPDVIVYGSIPNDFSRHVAARFRKLRVGPQFHLTRLMRNSASALSAFEAEHPAGLEQPLGRYRRQLADVAPHSWWRPWTWPVQDVLAFVYTALARRLQPLGERLGIVAPPGEPRSGQIAGPYRCSDTHRRNARDFNGFGHTNTLAYLAELRDRTGIPVVAVQWPIAHEPSGACYNSYATNQLVSAYRAWITAEAERLGLPLIDLSQTLLPRDFLDTLHPNARGQRKIAYALAPFLDPVLRKRAVEVLPPTEPH
jgi:hypothetical protein